MSNAQRTTVLNGVYCPHCLSGPMSPTALATHLRDDGDAESGQRCEVLKKR